MWVKVVVCVWGDINSKVWLYSIVTRSRRYSIKSIIWKFGRLVSGCWEYSLEITVFRLVTVRCWQVSTPLWLNVVKHESLWLLMHAWSAMVHILRVVGGSKVWYLILWHTLSFLITLCIEVVVWTWFSHCMGDVGKDSFRVNWEWECWSILFKFCIHWTSRLTWFVLAHACIRCCMLFILGKLWESLTCVTDHFNLPLALWCFWLIKFSIFIIWLAKSHYCLPLSLCKSLRYISIVGSLRGMHVVRLLASIFKCYLC